MSNTSRPAPASRFCCNASIKADWSTTGPRAVFIRMAEGFILANCSRPITPRVSSVKGRWRLTMSLRPSNSSSSTCSIATLSIRNLWRSKPST